jgi:hypothetical protein
MLSISIPESIMTDKTYLKVKIKSLADEARTIRAEEKKASGRVRQELHEHRVKDVRQETRAALVAYGYIRGRTYRQIEPRTLWDVPPYCRPSFDVTRVAALVRKYGPDQKTDAKEIAKAIIEWRKAEPCRPKEINPPRAKCSQSGTQPASE